MTLWFVGSGLSGPAGMPEEARRAVAGAAAVYVETYTNPAGPGYADEARALAGGQVERAPRWMVEDGSRILESARAGDAVLLCPGDPFAATTHLELRARAEAAGIPTRAVHGASALTAAVGECGLHQYKVGGTATVMSGPAGAEAYGSVLRNAERGLHTVLLLEHDEERGFSLPPGEAIGALLAAEESRRRGAFTPETYVAVASRVGSGSQAVAAGRAGSLRGRDFGPPPHTLVVPAAMHFTEAEAMAALADCADAPPEGANRAGTVCEQMVAKYAPAVRRAADALRPGCGAVPRGEEILDGASRYADDAERFLAGGEPEVAVLCAGYADGLADSVRIARGLDPEGA